jgi:hypothetical protein
MEDPMVNGRTPFYLTGLALGLLGAVLILFQPYSAEWPGRGYAKPARQFLHAALRQDSADLVRRSASSSAVRWGLDAGRAHAESLRLWKGRIEAWTGERRGETTEVFVYPPGPECAETPIALEFIGSGEDARVVRASAPCWRAPASGRPGKSLDGSTRRRPL